MHEQMILAVMCAKFLKNLLLSLKIFTRLEKRFKLVTFLLSCGAMYYQLSYQSMLGAVSAQDLD